MADSERGRGRLDHRRNPRWLHRRLGHAPIFAAYATVVLPDPEDGLDPPEQETEWGQYVWVYDPSWGYVLVAAGPEQAGAWRDRGLNLALPDLIFPVDCSWLLSTLWDDD